MNFTEFVNESYNNPNPETKEDDSFVEPLQEKIKKENGKYVVYPKRGKRKLGEHNTKKEALAQLAAIEISKKERKSK